MENGCFVPLRNPQYVQRVGKEAKIFSQKYILIVLNSAPATWIKALISITSEQPSSKENIACSRPRTGEWVYRTQWACYMAINFTHYSEGINSVFFIIIIIKKGILTAILLPTFVSFGHNPQDIFLYKPRRIRFVSSPSSRAILIQIRLPHFPFVYQIFPKQICVPSAVTLATWGLTT